MNKRKKISLIDGSGFIFRAYYALPPLTSKNGKPVGAVLGFCNMLLKLIQEKESDKLIVVFDSAKKTFRNNIYSDYKANRGEAPEDLIPQFKIIREAVDAFDITRIELEGYEADDLIATYAKFFDDKDWSVEIVSSDKDLMQLINNNIFMKDPIKNKIIKENEVFEKFGVYPEKVIDVQTLTGDKVDNIPGAPGIGIKTAALLVNQFGSLKGILSDFKKIKQNKRREAIEFNIENIAISKKLVELKKDVKVEINIDKISSSDFDKKKLLEFFKKYNFENLKTKIENFDGLKSEENNGKNIQVSYRTILKKEELIDVVKKITETGYVAIDTETNSIKPFGANLIGISLS